MVKSYSKLVVASILISAAVPANAMWRSFASRVGKSVSLTSASLVGAGALLGKFSADIYATTPTHCKWNRLDSACSQGCLWMVKTLEMFGANVHTPSGNYWGGTPLHIAASNGQKDVVRFLLEKGVATDVSTFDGRTALHEACEKGHEEVSIALLSCGAKINSVDCNGKTPLHYACKSGETDLVEELLVRGADFSIRDNKGESVLDIRYSNPRMRTILRSYELEKLNDPEVIS